jgi:hypothetical protein
LTRKKEVDRVDKVDIVDKGNVKVEERKGKQEVDRAEYWREAVLPPSTGGAGGGQLKS